MSGRPYICHHRGTVAGREYDCLRIREHNGSHRALDGTAWLDDPECTHDQDCDVCMVRTCCRHCGGDV